MKTISQKEKAAQFTALHQQNETLILPNVWDCTSARLTEQIGFKAMATTSSGISWSLGYKDGEHTPADLMLQVLARIASSVSVPVSADVEAGYFGNDLDKFQDFIQKLLDTGIVGFNLEDRMPHTGGLHNIEIQTKKIALARQVANDRNLPAYINARTDVMTLKEIDDDEKVKQGVIRSQAYQAAGASGIFIPFVADINLVKAFKEKIELPLNMLMHSNLTIKELKKLNVDRVTVGGKLFTVAMNRFIQVAKQLQSSDDWQDLYVAEPNHIILNSWFQ